MAYVAYVAEHKAFCKDKNRYLVTQEVPHIEDKRGVIISNTDPGRVISIICESCKAPAVRK